MTSVGGLCKCLMWYQVQKITAFNDNENVLFAYFIAVNEAKLQFLPCGRMSFPTSELAVCLLVSKLYDKNNTTEQSNHYL